jgi:putative endonuclease
MSFGFKDIALLKNKSYICMKKWYVYIVECEKDGTLYTGITTDVNRRISEHNSGKGAKYTRNRNPVVLRTLFTANNRREA